jgi:hypothetical protein
MKILRIGRKLPTIRRWLGDKVNGGAWTFELSREELCRQFEVTPWGWGFSYGWNPKMPLSEVMQFFGVPDVVYVDRPCKLSGWDEVTGVLRAVDVGDLTPPMAEERRGMRWKKYFSTYPFDVYFSRCWEGIRYAKEILGAKHAYYGAWGVETHVFRDMGLDRYLDVVTLCSDRPEGLYANRREMRRMLETMPYEVDTGRAFFNGYIDRLNRAKILASIASNISQMIRLRIYEAMACGVLVIDSWCEEYDVLGFKNEEHIVFHSGLEDLREKIVYYLERPKKLNEIARSGKEFVVENFRVEKAIARFGENLERHLNAT